jgi:SUF system NifU family Fe-S assembly protein
MSDPLRELYQEVIVDHGKRPRNFRRVEAPSRSAEGFNPLCGDQLRLELRLADGVIEDIAFQGQGCAISQASASLLTLAVKGMRQEQALELFARVHAGGGARQAGGAGRGLGVPAAGQVRRPGLAHPAQRPRRRRCACLDGVEHDRN